MTYGRKDAASSVAPPSSAPRWWSTAVRAVAAVAATLAAAGTVYVGFVAHATDAVVAGAVVGLAGLAGLVLRERYPTGVLATELVLGGCVELLAGGSRLSATARFVVVVSLYSMGTRTETRRGVAAAGVAWAVLGGCQLLDHQGAGPLAGDLVLVAAVTATSLYVRSHRALIDSYRERAEQAEREQEWQTSRAVAAERVRIARELHDVVAHHVSLLVVQAGGVRETLPGDHRTRPVLDSMIDGGRTAMAELRTMLDALRVDALSGEARPAAGGDRHPQPDADQVGDLVNGARCAGLHVDLTLDGCPRALPPATSLAVYRIVQESLTNVVKHAPGSATLVRLSYNPAELEVLVANTQAATVQQRIAERPGRPSRATSGHGLAAYELGLLTPGAP